MEKSTKTDKKEKLLKDIRELQRDVKTTEKQMARCKKWIREYKEKIRKTRITEDKYHWLIGEISKKHRAQEIYNKNLKKAIKRNTLKVKNEKSNKK